MKIFVLFPLDEPDVPQTPCIPSPCGTNAMCREQNGAGSCICLPEYIGNPYEGCRPECTLNSDCSASLACIRSKCQNPCPGACGRNAQCQVVAHLPLCTCVVGYTGDPFSYCNPIPADRGNCFFYRRRMDINKKRGAIADKLHFMLSFQTEPTVGDPCNPSPCGPNSRCQENNGHAACSCLPSYIGSAPNCRPECIVSSECQSNLACINQKCQDPCPGTCGNNAQCRVLNHSPICSCENGLTGDPFTNCYTQGNYVYLTIINAFCVQFILE